MENEEKVEWERRQKRGQRIKKHEKEKGREWKKDGMKKRGGVWGEI